MPKHSLPRLGALAALALVALLVVVSPVFARTITVDGNPADWTGSSFAPINDPDEALILVNRLDVSQVYYTYNTTSLFFRIDTYASTTNWAVGFSLICLNIDNNLTTGGSIDQCEDAGSQDGVDYVIRIIPDNPTFQVRTCPNGATDFGGCPTTGTFSFATATNVSEIGIAFTDIGISQAGCPGAGYVIPTSVYLDNGTGDPDDNVPDSGEFTITLDCPLPVTLTAFTATRGAGGVELAWTTSSELNIQGYHILRSAGGREAATRITTEIIPGEGSGVTGGTYRFADTTAAVGSSYSYWLEVINSDGSPEEYGPVSYAPSTAARSYVYLPLVVK